MRQSSSDPVHKGAIICLQIHPQADLHLTCTLTSTCGLILPSQRALKILQPSLYLGTFSVYIVTQSFFPYCDFDRQPRPDRTKSLKACFRPKYCKGCTLFKLIAVPPVTHCLPAACFTGGTQFMPISQLAWNFFFYIFL